MIRLYQPADREALLELFRLNTPVYFHPQEQADLEQFLTEESQHYYVLEEDGKILASGGYAIEDNEGWLTWYIVHPDQQGKGLGAQLVNNALERMSKQKLDKLVVRTSQLVYKFYEKFGYRLVSTQDDYWAPGLHLYHMEMEAHNLTRL